MNICGTECGMCAKMIRLVKLYSLLKVKKLTEYFAHRRHLQTSTYNNKQIHLFAIFE